MKDRYYLKPSYKHAGVYGGEDPDIRWVGPFSSYNGLIHWAAANPRYHGQIYGSDRGFVFNPDKVPLDDVTNPRQIDKKWCNRRQRQITVSN